MVLLPVTAQDFLIRELSPQERLYYSLINKESYEIVSSFSRRAFRVEKVLWPYFDHNEIDEFRMIQYHTGTLISGSTALQFFDLTVYESSDLDLYVDTKHCSFLGEFLLRIGYQFQPFKHQKLGFHKALAETISGDRNERRIMRWMNGEFEERFEDYEGNGIATVFNFVRDGRTIQVVVAETCAMDVIFAFHSTCVMNIISHSHAYSLYPRATFIDRIASRNIKFRGLRTRHEAAREKYRQRGWELIDIPSASVALRRCPEFSDARCVGDSACWVIRLPSQTTYGPDPIRINSWSNSSHPWDNMLLLEHETKTDERLDFGYCISQFTDWQAITKIFDLLDELEGKNGDTSENDYIDKGWASWISFLINKAVKTTRDPAAEKIRVQLANIYENELPSFQERPDAEKLCFPVTSTASALLRHLVRIQNMFEGDLTYAFTFRVSEQTKHVWTNVKVTPPPVALENEEYSTCFRIIRILKAFRVGLMIDHLRVVTRYVAHEDPNFY
ncbi:hypothetical protein BT96DRAFT_990910 [Gymnopus androsaceus JB14]|uniref:Uncharacterized protein n=1 Tax=Gymnopus androsaceus JB14 TaxID=1447944 RepID=A0A6A4I0C9_9AGAR|nr:hypothetical protein BT96DRAFT_990910 [Gymnopus androsaceus JB14]